MCLSSDFGHGSSSKMVACLDPDHRASVTSARNRILDASKSTYRFKKLPSRLARYEDFATEDASLAEISLK